MCYIMILDLKNENLVEGMGAPLTHWTNFKKKKIKIKKINIIKN